MAIPTILEQEQQLCHQDRDWKLAIQRNKLQEFLQTKDLAPTIPFHLGSESLILAASQNPLKPSQPSLRKKHPHFLAQLMINLKKFWAQTRLSSPFLGNRFQKITKLEVSDLQ